MSITFVAKTMETRGPSVVLKRTIVYWHVIRVFWLTVLSTSALCEENTSLSM